MELAVDYRNVAQPGYCASRSIHHHDDGLTDAQTGHDGFYDHMKYGKRGNFDAVFYDDDSTLFDAQKVLVAVGCAEPTLNYGQMVPVRDEPAAYLIISTNPTTCWQKAERPVSSLMKKNPMVLKSSNDDRNMEAGNGAFVCRQVI
ncbi:hypothetical protein [Vibrio cortegadensis]|uniref:hypothetical protein n=1 Tax=Vibrio cortegadensis TaxID=1328770 RepID=UPI0021C39C62|nr:hypothetical protein [Vibrio cortegadensis]